MARDGGGRGSYKFMELGMAGKLDEVTLHANTFLNATGELAVGWMLLQAAVIADEKLQKEGNGAVVESGDRSALEMPDGGF